MEVPVTIQLLGRAASYDRSFNLKVSSENADLGIDYELNNKAELPAGETTVNYIVTLKRTDILQQEIKELLVEISANDNFIIPFAFQMESANEISTTRYRILFSDQFTAPPVCWEALMIGEISHIKFILICDVLDFDPADFNVAGSISLAQWIFISQQMSSYVTDQESLKASGLPYDERVYNEDGSTVKFKR